jgi:pimeloyl-ACP methyl ester carboxylesterase
MTKFIAVEDSLRIAYSISEAKNKSNDSLTFVLSPSLGDMKEEYRFLAPLLSQDGTHTVISVDLRGMGESDVGFLTYLVEDSGKDIVKLVTSLNLSNVVLVGNSLSGAAVVYAASELEVKGVVLISPFAWDHKMPFGVPTLLALTLNDCLGPSIWTDYYKSLYTLQATTPTIDLLEYVAKLKKNLKEKGRMKALYSHVFASKKQCEDRILHILTSNIPTIAIYGSKDPDFPNIKNEIVEIKEKFGSAMYLEPFIIEAAGHYPQVELPEEVYQAIVTFLKTI